MKRCLSLLLVLLFVFSVFGCTKSESSSDEVITTNDYETTTRKVDEGNGNNSGSFGSFVQDEPNSFGIEVFDDVSNNSINFSIEDFKLQNVENFDEVDMNRIDDFTEEELKLLSTTKFNLLNELKFSFEAAGINIEINDTTGEISLDSSVLFGGDSAELSSEGKAFLKKFISTYSNVILSEEFDGFVSKIIIEGHTAPLSGSTYESGLPLSEERANNVKKYCLSSDVELSSDDIAELKSLLEAVGMSNKKPVKDSAGNVDIAASRRVSFRFLINLE